MKYLQNSLKITFYFAVFLLALFNSLPLWEDWGGAFSQCAMCRAITQSNTAGGGTTALGINYAILYLLTIPYILLIAGGIFWYFDKRKRKISSV